MSLTVTLNEPSYALHDVAGLAVSADVPGKMPVALDGRAYLIDETIGIRPASIPQLREQADTSVRQGEQSLNPEALWRRSAVSWHRGAGQEFYDREDSDPFRFRTSKGVDVFGERYQLTLLPDTDQKRASTNTNLRWVVGGDKVYALDGTAVEYTEDITVDSPSFTDTTIQAGESATTVEDATSDGHNLYAALGANGIHRSVDGASATHYNDLQATLVGYVKGRLMAAETNSVYNVTASGAAPSALMDHDNTDFAWVGFAEGLGQIFMAGFSGDKSEIWKTAVKADGTALDTPSIAGRLNDGEIVRTIKGYQGFLLIGTDDGIRLATERDDGNLAIGALLDLGVSVRDFEPHGKDGHVWFTWTNFDGTSTGLGRLDLAADLLPGGAPVYASDLMATTQGTVLSVATFQDRRIFAVSGDGFWGEDTDKVASGTIESGLIAFDVPEDKTLLFLDVRHHTTGFGSATPHVAVDGGDFSALSASTSGTGNRSGAGRLRGELFELKIEMARSSSDQTLAPTITRWSLLAEPTGTSAYFLDVPFIITTFYDTPQGTPEHRDAEADIDHILDLRASGEPVLFQRGNKLKVVRVWEFGGELIQAFGVDPASPEARGIMPVRLKVFPT